MRGLDLIELNISGTSVADLTPLREMHTLEKLDMSESKVTDLAALSALRLKSLNFQGCPVSDLTPIRKMPLEEMNLRETRVADLSPLIGMPIKSIDLAQAPVLDFSPLAQLPLEKCYLQRNRITDLAVLRGKPLKELVLWGCDEARNYAAIAEIKTLELLLLPSEYRDLPDERLRSHRLAAPSAQAAPTRDGLAAWAHGHQWLELRGHRIGDTAAPTTPPLPQGPLLAGLGPRADLPPGPAQERIQLLAQQAPHRPYALDIRTSRSRPLHPQRRADQRTHSLRLPGLRSDADPRHEARMLSNSPAIRSPISVRCAGCRSSGCSSETKSAISPRSRVCRSRELYLEVAKLTDVAPLAEIPTLENLIFPPQATNIETLRKLPKLRRLGLKLIGMQPVLPDTTAEEYWRQSTRGRNRRQSFGTVLFREKRPSLREMVAAPDEMGRTPRRMVWLPDAAGSSLRRMGASLCEMGGSPRGMVSPPDGAGSFPSGKWYGSRRKWYRPRRRRGRRPRGREGFLGVQFSLRDLDRASREPVARPRRAFVGRLLRFDHPFARGNSHVRMRRLFLPMKSDPLATFLSLAVSFFRPRGERSAESFASRRFLTDGCSLLSSAKADLPRRRLGNDLH